MAKSKKMGKRAKPKKKTRNGNPILRLSGCFRDTYDEIESDATKD
jgi:hypothetical protein